MITRRTFLERLGLGAGATVLAPVAATLFDEAMGHAQVADRKRVVFFMVGNAISLSCSSFVPPELKGMSGNSSLVSSTSFTWGRMVQNLTPLRNKTLLIDGLSNEIPSSQHSCGFGTLSGFACANGGSAEYGGPPGGITIDQHIANTLGKDTRLKSLLTGTTAPGMFAKGSMQRVQHFTDPKLAYDAVFGDLLVDPSGVNKGAIENKLLLDKLRGDIKKMQGALAAGERMKLDQYLGALDEFERRSKVTLPGTCKVPSAPMLPMQPAPEDRLDAFTDLVSVALVCGLTNVGAVAAGTGMSHQYFHRYTRISKGTQFESLGGIDGYGHDGCDKQGPAMDLIHDFHAGLMARMATTLGGIKQGNGTMFDNTVLVYLSDSGDEHHGSHRRIPVVMVGTAGGKLKADGRYLRYPDKGKAGARTLPDLWTTIANAVGVPTDRFGMGGVEKANGPLPEIAA